MKFIKHKRHFLYKLVRYEYKNRKLYGQLSYPKYLRKRCKFIIDIFADTFIFEQGLFFNYNITFCEESNGWELNWSHGTDSCCDKKHFMIISDIIDIATLRWILEKDFALAIRRDMNKWNKNEPIL